jgi:hypothetical protein
MAPKVELPGQALLFFQSRPLTIQIVLSLLAFLAAVFIFRFLVPSLWMHWRFSSIIRKLQRSKRDDVSGVDAAFSGDKTLGHLWTEYQHTIHKQYNQGYKPASAREGGQVAQPILRSTVPAASVFTTEAMVDSRLSTEFFKHLPGLFTGIGIIGTFLGLIQGLQAFKVSDNATVVRNSLELLMHGVYEAFLVSALAISAAMVTTGLERWLIAGLYKKAEAITFEIDSMFESGVEEEYLERLVSATEQGTYESKALKDALVADLGSILAKLTEQQIVANREATKTLGEEFSKGLEKTLSGPLGRIADVNTAARESNTEAVTNLLTDVLAGFSQRLEELFGNQIGGINQLQQQTIESLTKASTALESMATKIEAAGTTSSEAMAQKLTEAMVSMEGHQRVMNDRMAEFVDQIRSMVRDEQTETNRALQALIWELGEAVRSHLASLDEARKQESKAHGEREKDLAGRTETTVGNLTSLTEGLVGEIRVLTEEIRRTTGAMQTVTSDAVARMNVGTATLSKAAEDFSNAGQGVVGVLQQANAVAGALSEASRSLSSSSGVLKGVVDDHAAARENLAAMVSELRGIVEAARHEAAITSNAISRIETSAEKLAGAQKQADEYLAGVTKVLAESHDEFSTALMSVLGDAHREFFERLTAATGLLRTAIEELAATVDIIPSARAKAEKELV